MPRDPEALYARAAAWFCDRGTPYGVLVPDGLDHAPPGATLLHPLPAVARPLTGLPPLPDRTWSRGSAQEVARVQADAFGDLYETDLAFVGPVHDAPGRDVVVLREDGHAVATACVVHLGRTALVFDVAVLPDRQRQGLGRAVTLWCLHRAAALGADRVRLDPTPQGAPLYDALGFVPAPGWRVWRPG